jgi:hypothetical protein
MSIEPCARAKIRGPTKDIEASHWPNWLEDLGDSLVVYPQIVLAGNVEDQFLLPGEHGPSFVPFKDAIWQRLEQLRFQLLLSYDRVDQLKFLRGRPELARKIVGEMPPKDLWTKDLSQLSEIVRNVVTSNLPAALLIYASRMNTTAQQLNYDNALMDFFATCEKLSYAAAPIADDSAQPCFNPIIWVVNSINDLPPWFASQNHRIRTKILPRPNIAARESAAREIAAWFEGVPPAAAKEDAIGLFTGLTDGMPLNSLFAIGQLGPRGSDSKISIARSSGSKSGYRKTRGATRVSRSVSATRRLLLASE